jgi:uncharacterized protein YdhG (YjbR/CyaY superfamily)
VATDREAFFPKIEKKHGQPMKYWFGVMKDIADRKYPEQIAYLKEEHGFSQQHANALVMYARGSKSAKRVTNLTDFLKDSDAAQKKTVKAIYKAIQSKNPKLELAFAWNKPMLKSGDKYVFGVAVAKNHILLAPFDAKVLNKLKPKLKEYKVLKKTVQVPNNWKVDSALLNEMIKLSLSK